MKQVGIKLLSKHYHKYYYYFTADAVESQLYARCRDLKEGQRIVVKCGRAHYYMTYDRYEDIVYRYEISRIMYYVREYLG